MNGPCNDVSHGGRQWISDTNSSSALLLHPPLALIIVSGDNE